MRWNDHQATRDRMAMQLLGDFEQLSVAGFRHKWCHRETTCKCKEHVQAHWDFGFSISQTHEISSNYIKSCINIQTWKGKTMENCEPCELGGSRTGEGSAPGRHARLVAKRHQGAKAIRSKRLRWRLCVAWKSAITKRCKTKEAKVCCFCCSPKDVNFILPHGCSSLCRMIM